MGMWIAIVGIAVVILAAVFFLVSYRLPKILLRQLEDYQNALVARQLEEVRNTYRQMRGWRHDYRNHMQVLRDYVENRDWEKCMTYIEQMNQDLSSVDHVIKTGNVMADAIVNSKISLAQSKEIPLDVTVTVPKELPVSDVEFSILFGNLLDNAIEACEQIAQKEQRFIRIYTGVFRQSFYLSVTNATCHKERKRQFISKKGEGHGLGLYRIDQLVRANNGYLNRKNEPGVFATEIMLPFV